MKTNNPEKKQFNNSEQNLTRDISVIYLAVFAILMILSSRMVQADLKVSQSEQSRADGFPTLFAVGRGELTWFGLSIYKASLWTANGEFKSLNDSLPVALTIHYRKSIDSSALVERTVKEWQQLGIFNNDRRSYWSGQLKNIWPSVEKGDRITTLVKANRKTRFYHNNTLLAEIDDPAFGTALLSIWLDPNTSEPDLRAKLIGRKES